MLSTRLGGGAGPKPDRRGPNEARVQAPVGPGQTFVGREEEEEEEEEEEGLFRADAVNEEDPERDRATQV